MKFRLTALLLFILPIVLFAATRNVSSTGNWTDSGSWSGGNIPISTDDVTMSNNRGITVQAGETIDVVSITTGNNNTITVDATGQLTLNNSGLNALFATNGIVLNIDGDLIINGNLVVNNNLVINVTGSLTINGDVNLNNGASLDVTSTGDIDINGDFSGGNNTDVNVDGTIDVSGDVDVGNGSTLTGGGTFTLGGGCDDGSSSFCESSTLPVTLVSFDITSSNSSVEANWTTSDEENFDYFCLERSPDAREFSCIAEISGKNNSGLLTDYSYMDFNPIEGRSYYRLKAVDLDGSYEYFGIESAFFDNASYGFSIYPNPSHTGNFDLDLDFAPQGNLTIDLFNLQGSRILLRSSDPKDQKMSINSNLKSGIYIIKIQDDRGIMLSKKLIVH